MKTIYIRGGSPKNKSVQIMTHHLTQLGHEIVRSKDDAHDVVLGWGTSRQGVEGPMLNADVNLYNKFQAINVFKRNNIPAPLVFTPGIAELEPNQPFPWLARKYQHKQGRDIKPAYNLREVREMSRRYQPDFWSVFVPTKTEYRVWSFKNKALAIYEKVWKGEGEYDGIQRNHRFGFKFEKRDDLRESDISEWGNQAVAALEMDFGATDIIEGKDGEYYVLEVNSMPSIDDNKKSSGIRLAAAVSKWAERQ